MVKADIRYDPRYDIMFIVRASMMQKQGMLGLKPFDKFPKELHKILELKTDEEKAKVAAAWIEKTYKPEQLLNRVKQLESRWKGVEARFFQTLSSATKQPVKGGGQSADTFIILLGHTGFPMSFPAQFIGTADLLSSPEQNLTEIMHCIFVMHVFNSAIGQKIKSQLKNDNYTYLVSEVLTVLLNESPFSLGQPKDDVFPALKEFRNAVSQVWRESKDFDKVVDFCINVLKQNMKRESEAGEIGDLKKQPVREEQEIALNKGGKMPSVGNISLPWILVMVLAVAAILALLA